MLAADAILGADGYRTALLDRFRTELGHATVYSALLELDGAVRDVARYLLADDGPIARSRDDGPLAPRHPRPARQIGGDPLTARAREAHDERLQALTDMAVCRSR